MEAVIISFKPMSLRELIRVINGDPIEVSDDAYSRIHASRHVVEQILSTGSAVYGLNTGVGEMKDMALPREMLRGFQEMLLRTHAGGVGPPLSRRVVRGAMAVRLNGIARGGSSATAESAAVLAAMLNHGIHPVVPSVASVGAGDLPQMAFIALVAIGEGRAEYQGEEISGLDALARAGLRPVALEPGEGLALMSANGISVAHGALVLARAHRASDLADIAVALSLEATAGNPAMVRPEVEGAKPYPGQQESISHIRDLLDDSYLLQPDAPRSIQDAFSFRVAPQVHGALRHFIHEADWAVGMELNSQSDNPLISVAQGTMTHNGNFHPITMALAFDALRPALAHVAHLCERRMNHLWEEFMRRMSDAGLGAGMETHVDYPGMSLRYPAGVVLSELRHLAAPVTLDCPPMSNDIEDHATNAPLTVTHTEQATLLLEDLLAIEMLIARDVMNLMAQRPLLGHGTTAVLEALENAISSVPLPRTPAQVHLAAKELITDDALLTGKIKSVRERSATKRFT